MTDKVISIADRPKKEDKKAETEETGLDAVIRRNKENAERVAKERAAANKAVLRSHRIKH